MFCELVMTMFGKDEVVSKALNLIGKLQQKYGFKPKFYAIVPAPTPEGDLPTIFEDVLFSNKQEPPPDDLEEGEWCLVSSHGEVHRLPKTMIFLGREECDIELQDESVDKRHAVVTFDHYLRRFKIKDLSTNSGTYVNDRRIQEQEYVVLDEKDSVTLGYDPMKLQMERYQEMPHSNTVPRLDQETDMFSPVLPECDDLPSWASRGLKQNNSELDITATMAECQGCIAEQRIEHTCGEDIPECKSAHHDLDRSYSHDSISTFNSFNNTWPRKRHKVKKNVKEIFSMDDTDPVQVEGLIDLPQTRVLRGTGAPMNILPPELATVKKGTPLYGQPDWWGEEEKELLKEKRMSNGSMEGHQQSDERSASAADQPSDSQSRTNVTQNGVSETPNNVPKQSDSNKGKSPEGVTNMAFTVDFGNDENKSIDGKSLSDFVPSKIRKSFRERKEKTLEKASEKQKSLTKEKVPVEKTPDKQPLTLRTKEKISTDKNSVMTKSSTRAQSEGRDISPTHQRKIEDLWNSGQSTGTSEAVLNKRQRMSKTSRSMDLDDESIDNAYNKAAATIKRRSQPMSSAPYSKPKSVIRARKAVSQEILASSTQYTSENASFLIDKMFRNNSTGSVDSLKPQAIQGSIPEYELYSEAKKFDTDKSKSSVQNESVNSAKVSQSKVANINGTKDEQDTTKKSTEATKVDEDKVSEAGTYTIEDEKDAKEEEEARKNIEKVFNVTDLIFTNSTNLTNDLKLTKPSKQGELTLNLHNINSELEEIERLEKQRAQRGMIDSMEGQVGSAVLDDEDEENPAVPGDAPKWVTQWAALTSQKSGNKSDMDLSSPGSSISDDKSSTKTPNGLSRKRPGTGRRLPTIPPGATSPTMSDSSVTKESPRASITDLTISGTTQTQRQRAVKPSSHGQNQEQELESSILTKGDSGTISLPSSSRGKHGSNGSVASLDTEILLKDTQTVMTAMEQRVTSKSTKLKPDTKDKENGHLDTSNVLTDLIFDSDVNESVLIDDSMDAESDSSSVVALVNGDEEFVKPSYYKSPRDVLGRGKLKIKESLPSKPSINMGGSRTKTESTRSRKTSVEEGQSIVSDIYSDVNGDTCRTNDSDLSDTGQFTRQGSRGKGTMTMTRPNRAFALRRALADGDEPDTSRSTASTVSIGSTSFNTPRAGGSLTNLSKSSTIPQKPRRPLSGKFSDRQQPDSSRSQASLGAQIVQRSRENVASSSSSQGFGRTDGGRHSMRASRSLSIPARQPSTPESRQRRSDIGVSSSSSNLQHSKSLRVTGVSARERTSSVTKSGTRTTSPKSAERNAWKRRKDYDPRKAVADAKSKAKEKTHGKGVTRSASFNNARDLKLSSYQCDSISSADDTSRRSSTTSDVFDDGPKRGFVPYSGRSLLSSKVSNSSADDDDVEKSIRSSSTHSTQAATKSKPKSKLTSSKHTRSYSAFTPPPSRVLPKHPVVKSAFTPPPEKPLPLSVFVPKHLRPSPKGKKSSPKVTLKTPSPPPITSSSMAHLRHSADSLGLYRSTIGHKKELPDDKPRVPESYDTIIVSSIYQLSAKLKSLTDKTMDKLRDSDVIENGTDSPLDELDRLSMTGEIPAYKSANQELAGVLKNLRKIEQHIKVMNKVLFPDDEQSPDTSKEKHEYLQEIERIRNELAGFQPIDTPREEVWKQHDTASVESDCEELSQGEFY